MIYNNAALAMEDFTNILRELTMEYGRCLWCGFVFCDHLGTYYKFCWLEDRIV